MSVFNLPASTVDRSMLLCFGRYGTRAMAHLLPRLSFEDLQRQILRPGLPSLARLSAKALLIPQPDGSVRCGAPLDARFDAALFRALDPSGAPDGLVASATPRWLDTLSNALEEPVFSIPGDGEPARGKIFRNALEGKEKLGDWLAAVAHGVRGDAEAHGADAYRFVVYVIASLADPESSALLWPTVMALRETLGRYLPLKVVGLLNTGVYSATRPRQSEAAVHVALQELVHFSMPKAPSDDPLRLPAPALPWSDQPYFDLCLLLDNEKRNGARCNDEAEAIVNTGNTVEVMLCGDALYALDEEHSASEADWRGAGAFGSVGTASIYVPIEEWRQRNRMEYEAELLRDRLLQPAAETPMSEEDRTAAAQYLDIAPLMRRMVEGCPLHVVEPPGHGAIGRLLDAAGMVAGRRRRREAEPLPELAVDEDELRVDYTLVDPVSERRRRLAPEEWPVAMYRHYRRLGLDPNRIFPGDPLAAQAEAAAPPPVVTRQQEWWDLIGETCAAGSERAIIRNAADLGAVPMESLGIEASFRAFLQEKIAAFLRGQDNGLFLALAWLDPLRAWARKSGAAVDRNRVLLDGAIAQLQVELDRRRQGDLLALRTSLTNRPRLAGLLPRLVALLALLAVVGVEVLPRILFPFDLTRWPRVLAVQQWFATHLPVTAGLTAVALCLLIAGITLFVSRRRLLSIRAQLEDDLAEEMGRQVNRAFITLLYEDGAGALSGLREMLSAHDEALRDTLRALTERRDELARDLLEPLGRDQSFIREPMPGLDDIRRRLELESRRDDPKDSWPLLATDAAAASFTLEGLLSVDAVASLPATSPMAYAPEALAEARRNLMYGSLGNLILSAAQRTATRLRDIRPSADLRLDALLRERCPDLSPWMLIETLFKRASVALAWDDTAPERLGLKCRLIAIEQPARSRQYEATAAAYDARLIASLDPYSITVIQTAYGLTLTAAPHLEAYAVSFDGLPKEEKIGLLLSDTALDAKDRYLARGGTNA